MQIQMHFVATARQLRSIPQYMHCEIDMPLALTLLPRFHVIAPFDPLKPGKQNMSAAAEMRVDQN